MKFITLILFIVSLISCESDEAEDNSKKIYNMYPAPSHLADIVIDTDSIIKSEVYKDYGDYSTIFKVNKSLIKLEVNWIEEYNCQGGIVYATDINNKKITVFNSDKHGYNGQYQIYEEDDDSILKELISSGSLKDKEIILVFQYGGDEKEYASENGSDKPEDYFDWFAIYVIDGTELKEIYEYECA